MLLKSGMDRTLFQVIVILGIVGTFVPQYVRIKRKKSSIGLDPFFMFLGFMSIFYQFLNVILLDWNDLMICKNDCSTLYLGVSQIFVLFLSVTLNCVLFFIYYPNEEIVITLEKKRIMKNIATAFCLCFISFLVVFILAKIYGMSSYEINVLGKIFGYICFSLSCVQYVPQLYKTITTFSVGALSMTTLGIQAPGSFLFAYTIASLKNSDVSTWISFLISGVFQTLLFLTCFFINRSYSRLQVSETDPLLDSR